MLPFLKWDVGIGNKVDFWEDSWIINQPLLSLHNMQTIKPLLSAAHGSIVQNYYNWMENPAANTPTWRAIDHISNQHAEAKEFLLSLLSKHKFKIDKEDRLMWFPSPDGKYTIKSAYKCFEGEVSSPWPPLVWSKIWKNRAWPKA